VSEAPSDNRESALQVERLEKPINVGEGGIVLQTANDVWAIAKGICAAKMAPRSLDTPDKVAVAILTGAEAGLSPMMSIRSIYVINGAPAWLSKAARALVLNSGLLKPGTSIQEGVTHAEGCKDGETEDRGCVNACYGYCKTHRNGDVDWRESRFSVADAKVAKLWNDPKKEPWKRYPKRMLIHRAAGFHFDDCWSEVLMGLTTVEVLRDHPQAAFVREGETVATYAEPPGKDPLLAHASGGGDVIDVPDGGEETDNEAAGETVVAATSGADDRAPDPAASDDSSGEDIDAELLAEAAELDDPHGPCQCGAALSEHDGGRCPNKPPSNPATARAEAEMAEPPDLVKCETCPRSFKRSEETHWPYADGDFRCSECGPRENIK